MRCARRALQGQEEMPIPLSSYEHCAHLTLAIATVSYSPYLLGGACIRHYVLGVGALVLQIEGAAIVHYGLGLTYSLMPIYAYYAWFDCYT
eukprot:6457851-Amphidinium_carterae.1